ncbi:DEAD/DEAH box helicase [Crocinitomicaceae bacterium]|nr:DEAD/DEAH box helicase [Crocinitomicaceae bacterium]
MNNPIKNQAQILQKMGIDELNPMQNEAIEAIEKSNEVLILSPTGTGKTLAFLLPLIARLDANLAETQLLILVPARELAIQIEQVVRDMGTGYKVNAVYGGRSGSKEKIELTHAPTILVGTPGRVADHIRRDRITLHGIKNLVIDEFDKSLEIGFEKEMKEIVSALHTVDRKILTSATHKEEVPEFLKFKNPVSLDYLDTASNILDLSWVHSSKNTLDTLLNLLESLGEKRGIIFCNFKDTLDGVSQFLKENRVEHSCFFGGMEQVDRERSLIQFRNSSQRTLLATDLAARGIDIPGLDYIVHYEIPPREEEFTHRNGRTARMNTDGSAICIKGKNDKIPEYARGIKIMKIKEGSKIPKNKWKTLFVSGGRRDKISKGDIVGLFIKKGNLKGDELGVIELKTDCAFVAVSSVKADDLCDKLNNERLKKKKVRIHTI